MNNFVILPLTLALLIITFPVNGAGNINPPKAKNISPKKIILNIKLSSVQKRLCRFSRRLCPLGNAEFNFFRPYFSKMLFSVISYESDGFKFKAGLDDPYDIGLGQVNVKEWPLPAIRRFGFDVSSVKTLKKNVLNINVAACILWYNILVAISSGSELSGVYKYSAYYHNPNKFDLVYYRRVKKYIYG